MIVHYSYIVPKMMQYEDIPLKFSSKDHTIKYWQICYTVNLLLYD